MKRMCNGLPKKTRLLFFVLLFLVSNIIHPNAHANQPFHISGQAGILMDVDSGRILYAKNIDQPLRIASITKIMTAIIAIEEGILEDKVKTSKNAYRVEGSSIYLRLGETLTLEEMLYGLMLRSGNDAAVAIAEHIGGSVEGFVFLMNQKAAELGMNHSVFSNPHGLDTHEEHYSTARDMAVLTSYALKNETFQEIVKTKSTSASLEGESWDRRWYNKNQLLSKYPYADGVKTGYTRRAGRTLVSSATKDGHSLVAVTLNASDDWNDHIRMFEYGFNHYDPFPLAFQGEKLNHQELRQHHGHFSLMNHFTYPLMEDEKVTKKIVMHPSFQSEELEEIPYPAGYIYYSLGQEEIGRVAIEYIPEETKSSIWQQVVELWIRVVGGRSGG